MIVHNKFVMQIKFAKMIKDYCTIPFFKFRKRSREWERIKKFAQEHKDCCEIKFDK